MKNKIVVALLLSVFFLSACGDVSKVLRNEKVRGADEFTVKKREPLTMPPDFDQLLKPGSKSSKKDKQETIQSLLRSPQSVTTKSTNKPSSNEEKIINQIRN